MLPPSIALNEASPREIFCIRYPEGIPKDIYSRVSYRTPEGNKYAMQVLRLQIPDKERVREEKATLQMQGLRTSILP